jgi:hypothetical protein
MKRESINLSNCMEKEDVMFCYRGAITQNIIKTIGNSLKHDLEYKEESTTVTMNLFSVFVEQMQNVVNYSAKNCEHTDEPVGLVMIGVEEGTYFITCGNPIKNSDIERINSNIQKLQSMSKEELRKYYKQKMKEGPDDFSSGAGLGLIEMARRASNPIEYEIKEIDDTISYFSITVRI